jgi:WXG100 family type VII secretion target
MADIRVSPDRLREVASQLDAQSASVEEGMQAMIHTVNNLAGEWTGLAQVDYANLFNQQVPQMQARLRELLANLSGEMRRIANVFEATDQSVI